MINEEHIKKILRKNKFMVDLRNEKEQKVPKWRNEKIKSN